MQPTEEHTPSPSPKPIGSTGDHMANERTFLAWIRTGIGIMAFGFVVVKFSLFVKQFSLLFDEKITAVPNNGYASVLGIILVIVGLLISVCSYVQFRRNTAQLISGKYIPSSLLSLMLIISILLIGILLVVYLIYSYLV